jgi:hypothetical protein
MKKLRWEYGTFDSGLKEWEVLYGVLDDEHVFIIDQVGSQSFALSSFLPNAQKRLQYGSIQECKQAAQDLLGGAGTAF